MVDFGHELTKIVSVKNGHVDVHRTREFLVGGKHVDLALQLQIDSLSPLEKANPFFGFIIRRLVKERLTQNKFTLPDGKQVSVSNSDNLIEMYTSQISKGQNLLAKVVA